MTSGFLLDTNIPSEQMRPRPEPLVRQWLRGQPETSLYLSSVTPGEVRKGIVLLPDGKRRVLLQQWLENDLIPRFSGRILSVTTAIANRWGVLAAQRQLAGAPLGVVDGLIAATALELNLTLVTLNVKDFASLGVPLLNPWEPQS